MRALPGGRDVLPGTSRYELLLKIAAGGMATVYAGRLRAAGGVTRLFAIKRAHAHLTGDPVFRRMFVSEARLASKIHHPNVVAVQDVEELDEELLLVMDYVEGVALADLALADLPAEARSRVGTRIVLDACTGLDAAHELRGDDGRRLEIVHRDVSPHNVLVGVDGIARLTDFGIAKSGALGGASVAGGVTATGALKGKLGYMAPEYVESGKADQRADVFALGVVLWEAVTGERLFRAATEVELMKVVLACEVSPPSSVIFAEDVAGDRRRYAGLDQVVLRALSPRPSDRFPTALAFLESLEQTARQVDLVATHREVGAVVESLAAEVLAARRGIVRSLQSEGVVSTETTLDTFDYAEPDQTHTLDPSNEPTLDRGEPHSAIAPARLAAPRAAPPPPPGPIAVPVVAPGKRSGSDRLAIVAIAAILVVGAWFGARALRAEPPAAGDERSPVAVGSSLPASAPVPPSPPAPIAVTAPPAALPPPALTAPDLPPAAPSRLPHRPPRASATPRPADPMAPAHAPPNPYKKTP
jgi:eukaryotic-like serine/threonine-protein kinase